MLLVALLAGSRNPKIIRAPIAFYSDSVSQVFSGETDTRPVRSDQGLSSSRTAVGIMIIGLKNECVRTRREKERGRYYRKPTHPKP